MSDPEKPIKSRPHRATSQGFRAAREAALTAALRANLKRRKAPEKPGAGPDSRPGGGDHENAQSGGHDDA
jgi:hypothetical protein